MCISNRFLSSLQVTGLSIRWLWVRRSDRGSCLNDRSDYDDAVLEPVAGRSQRGSAEEVSVHRRYPKCRAEDVSVRRRSKQSPLHLEQILAWADDHKSRTGDWPRILSGQVLANPKENWRSLDMALRLGQRGLRGGSSLPQLLTAHRGYRNNHALPPLTEDDILDWAKTHRAATGHWPQEKSGMVQAAPGESWKRIDMALRLGRRGLAGGSSLAQLLAARLGVRNQAALPPLTLAQIVAWAEAHLLRTGDWPRRQSGPIEEAPSETWSGVDTALHQGCRGLSGGDTLTALFNRYRQGSDRYAHLARQLPRRHQGQKRDHQRRQQAMELRQQGLTLSVIGQRLGCTKQRVSQLLKTGECSR